VVLVVSEDGWKELQANGTLAACGEKTLLVVDTQIEAVLPKCHVIRLPLRREAKPKRAALAALAAWLEKNPVLPAEAWEAVLALEPAERLAESAAALEIGRHLARRGDDAQASAFSRQP
jgi:hypothetical protein